MNDLEIAALRESSTLLEDWANLELAIMPHARRFREHQLLVVVDGVEYKVICTMEKFSK